MNITQKQILQGVTVTDNYTLAVRYSVSRKEIAQVLGCSIRTLQKKNANCALKLDRNISERCISLDNLFSTAVDYFGSEHSAKYWFRSKNRGLGNVTPFYLCDTFNGMYMVENSIIKLTYGMTP
jgi:putative toxin-antitoxin system antitoxin component (TIGR02293 family)